MHIPVMPHEFTISGHNSCTSQSPSHNKSPLAPQLTPSMATSIRTTTTKTTNSPPSTLTSTTAAPRKPSQLGLYCTDKENGVRSIPAESVSSAVKASTVASVPKHIYDSAMKTFYSVVKFLGKVSGKFEWENVHLSGFREDLLVVMKLFLMLQESTLPPKLSLKHPSRNPNKRTR